MFISMLFFLHPPVNGTVVEFQNVRTNFPGRGGSGNGDNAGEESPKPGLNLSISFPD